MVEDRLGRETQRLRCNNDFIGLKVKRSGNLVGAKARTSNAGEIHGCGSQIDRLQFDADVQRAGADACFSNFSFVNGRLLDFRRNGFNGVGEKIAGAGIVGNENELYGRHRELRLKQLRLITNVME